MLSSWEADPGFGVPSKWSYVSGTASYISQQSQPGEECYHSHRYGGLGGPRKQLGGDIGPASQKAYNKDESIIVIIIKNFNDEINNSYCCFLKSLSWACLFYEDVCLCTDLKTYMYVCMYILNMYGFVNMSSVHRISQDKYYYYSSLISEAIKV